MKKRMHGYPIQLQAERECFLRDPLQTVLD